MLATKKVPVDMDFVAKAFLTDFMLAIQETTGHLLIPPTEDLSDELNTFTCKLSERMKQEYMHYVVEELNLDAPDPTENKVEPVEPVG